MGSGNSSCQGLSYRACKQESIIMHANDIGHENRERWWPTAMRDKPECRARSIAMTDYNERR